MRKLSLELQVGLEAGQQFWVSVQFSVHYQSESKAEPSSRSSRINVSRHANERHVSFAQTQEWG